MFVLFCLFSSNFSTFVRTLKHLDVYPKTEEEIEVKTTTGGACK
jgi:hypothetical protein